GDDVLGFIYKVDLKPYTGLLIVFMICGGIIALQNLFIIAVTVVRYQKYMIYGYAAVSVVMLALGGFMLRTFDIMGLSLFFMATMLLLLIYCVILLLIAVQKKKGENA
ncbi:MAG: hypothetical protein IKV35_01230, partial [Clostridia bacterium]|nr:hypothetical protein [Clostridia bacterium]